MTARVASIVATLALACAGHSSPASAADEPIVLAGSGPWGLEYSEDSCTMRRIFGKGEQQTQLEIRRFSPDSEPQLTIFTAGWPSSKIGAKFRFEPDTEWRKIETPLFATFGGDYLGVIFRAEMIPKPEDADDNDDGSIDPARKAEVDAAYRRAVGITLGEAFTKDLTLRTGSLEGVHAAMEKCLTELLTHWNVDAEAHDTLTRRAVPRNFAALARAVQREYPSRMLRKGQPGLVRVRLGVDPKGKISGCHIQLDISDPAFEETACRRLSNAGDFLPALDKDAKPIASYWVTGIVYTVG